MGRGSAIFSRMALCRRQARSKIGNRIAAIKTAASATPAIHHSSSGLKALAISAPCAAPPVRVMSACSYTLAKTKKSD